MNAPTIPAEARTPAWMSAVLWLAAVYNVLWSATNLALPTLVFEQVGMPVPTPIEFWLGINALVGVLGVGYGIAATSPARHWGLVAVGLLSKLVATGGMAYAYATGALPEKFAALTIVNDAIWIVPLALILLGVRRAGRPGVSAARVTPDASAAGPGAAAASDLGSGRTPDAGASYQAAETAAIAAATRQATLHRGHMLSALSLRELADQTPTLVVFLRHTGCPFCRELVAEIAKQRATIEARGLAVVLVHQSPPVKAAKFFERYGLDQPEPVWHVSDPQRRLYATFELARGGFGQIFAPREMVRGFRAAILRGHLLGLPQGDGRQLGGAFLFYRRRIIKAHRAVRASDAPDLSGLAACRIDPPSPGPSAPAPAPAAAASRR